MATMVWARLEKVEEAENCLPYIFSLATRAKVLIKSFLPLTEFPLSWECHSSLRLTALPGSTSHTFYKQQLEWVRQISENAVTVDTTVLTNSSVWENRCELKV